jgi:siderophore synthetase component
MYDKSGTNQEDEESEEEDEMRISQCRSHLSNEVVAFLQENQEKEKEKDSWFVDNVLKSTLKLIATCKYSFNNL